LAPQQRALDAQQEAMRQTARQMVVVWETLMPELDAMAKRVEEQAREAMHTSAMVNRLIGTHAGMIQQIALTLERGEHPWVRGDQSNA
jgi:predicted ribonuclease YlaK